MDFNRILDEYFPRSIVKEAFEGDAKVFKDKSIGSELVDQEHGVQQIIRPLFNKDGICTHGIGTHPDYDYLSGTNKLAKGSICTLFLDIAKSSRLNIIYDLQIACLIKNRILKIAIEIIRAFDGYPHRMMGDAVMAFFGDKEKSDEQASIDIVNCAVVLRFFIVHYVVPRLEEFTGIDESKLGVRIGVDYGNADEVIWGAFGYDSAFEITAHGVSVDLCSKLQGMAGKNNIMMGQGLLDFIDYPGSYVRLKYSSSGEAIPYVKPNITFSDGRPLNYRCRIVSHDSHFSLMPFPEEIKEDFCQSVSDFQGVVFLCEWSSDNVNWHGYSSVSQPLGKELSLRFKILVRCTLIDSEMRYFSFKFTKVNHGLESRNNEDEGATEKPEIRVDSSSNMKLHLGHYYYEEVVIEGTRYRGIHEMKVEGFFNGSKHEGRYRNTIGVFIV